MFIMVPGAIFACCCLILRGTLCALEGSQIWEGTWTKKIAWIQGHAEGKPGMPISLHSRALLRLVWSVLLTQWAYMSLTVSWFPFTSLYFFQNHHLFITFCYCSLPVIRIHPPSARCKCTMTGMRWGKMVTLCDFCSPSQVWTCSVGMPGMPQSQPMGRYSARMLRAKSWLMYFEHVSTLKMA